MNKGRKNIRFKGIGVSPGIAIAKAYLFIKDSMEVATYNISKSSIRYEIRRFKRAVEVSKAQLERVQERLLKDGRGKEHIHLIDAHIMMLDDKMLINDTIKTIAKDRINAEWALKKVLESIRDFFDSIEDEYLRERGSDVDYIGDRVLSNLMNKKRISVSEIDEEVILVARDLSPTDTLQVQGSKVRGFLTDLGGRTSHTAIFARSAEIPAIVGIENITRLVDDGDVLIMDGDTGEGVIRPYQGVLEKYSQNKKKFTSYERSLHAYDNLPSETIDGYRVKLMGNIELPDEVHEVLSHGADGIGLFRTEFLYLNRDDFPSEDEQFEVYKKVVEMVTPNPTTIRTLDVGGDKLFRHADQAKETNPALGLRAIRLCLKRPDIFITQLKAILRASIFGKVRILFPMVSGIKELRMAKNILNLAKDDLRREGKPFDDVEIGVMIEVPSAAFIADMLAKEVNFFSIGTNDLLQYCLAIDRGNDRVDYLYNPLHPAILRIIRTVVKAGKEAGIDVGLCGEIAGEPYYTKILLALGLNELSMNALSILKVKKVIRTFNYSEVSKATDEELSS